MATDLSSLGYFLDAVQCRTKYVDKLTDEDIKNLFELFYKKECKITKIKREANQTYVKGLLSGSRYEEDFYLTDYYVGCFTRRYEIIRAYRKFMYSKFGDEYAKYYLLNYNITY